MDRHIVVVRVKRRRDEAAADEIVVDVPRKLARASDDVENLSKSFLGTAIGESSAGSSAAVAAATVPEDGQPATKAVKLKRLDIAQDDLSRGAISARMVARIRAVLHPKLDQAKAKRAKMVEERAQQAREAAYAAHRRAGAASVYGVATDSVTSPPAANPTVRVMDLLTGQSKQAGADSTGAGPSARLIRRYRMPSNPETLAKRATLVPLSRAVPNKILNPTDRRMDEAVWRAFREGDVRHVWEVIADGADVNYQRAASDLTTALHAAAFHGLASDVRSLLRHGALARVPDAQGRTAMEWAAQGGHTALAIMLRDVLHCEAEEIAAYYGTGASTEAGAGAGSAQADGQAKGESLDQEGGEQYELYYVDEEEDEGMDGAASGAGAVPRFTVGAEEGGVLLGQPADADLDGADELWEWRVPQEGQDEDYDDEDSNAEDAPGHDYPDEDEGRGSDSDEDGDGASSRSSASWTYYGGTKGVGARQPEDSEDSDQD